MSDTPRPTVSELLEHASWIHVLARSLVSDRDLADDLVQQTWLAALESSPPGGSSLRAWLARVLRNRAIESRRRGQRRTAREEAVARAEVQDPDSRLDARISIYRTVVQVVSELKEPYRSAILLRYFEGLPPRKIAARLGLPVKTVNTRLNRALDQLRSRFDEDSGGDRRTWVLALLPLFATIRDRSAPLALATRAQVWVAGVLAVGTLAWFAFRTPEIPAAAEIARPVPSSPRTPSTADLRPVEVEPDRRVPPPELDESPVPPDATASTVVGRVLDLAGDPVAAATVVYEAGTTLPVLSESDSGGVTVGFLPLSGVEIPDVSATTDPAGFFALRISDPVESGRIRVRAPGLVTLVPGTVNPDDPGFEHLVVACEPRPLSGVVVAPDGRAIEGASVQLLLTAELLARYAHATNQTGERRVARVGTDAQGRFELPYAPDVDGTKLTVALAGHHARNVPVNGEGEARDSLRIVLEPIAETGPVLAGRVLLADGEPLRGGAVSLDHRLARTDERGEFVLDASDVAPGARLLAVGPGLLPAVLDLPEELPSYVELVVDRPALSIRGRLLKADGEPVRSGWVWAADPTFIGLQQLPLYAEQVIDDLAHSYWHRTETDAQGNFELTGLMERSYLLRALDRDDLRMILLETGPVSAGGSEVELRLPTDAVYPPVRGRVTSPYGEPLEGVRIDVMLNAFATTIPETEEHVDYTLIGSSTVTDIDGSFAFPRGCGRFEVDLQASRRDTFGGFFAVPEEGVPDDLVIVLGRAVRVRVELQHAEAADEVSFHAPDGSLVEPREVQNTSARPMLRAPLPGGSSQVLWVTDLVAEVRLWLRDELVAEVPVELLPGDEVNELRF